MPIKLSAAVLSTNTQSALEAGLYTDEYLEMLNTVLEGRKATNIGAYCVGVVEGIVRNSLQRMPTLYLLQMAMNCNGVAEAVTVAQRWIEDEIAGHGHGGRRK